MMKKIIFLACMVVITIVLMIVILNNNHQDEDLGSKAIKMAKEFVEKEKVTIDNEKYLYMNEIIYDNVDAYLFNDCNMASGVLIRKEKDHDEYKAILKCANYNSVINKSEIVKLNGEPIIVLNYDDEYQELGWENSTSTILKEEKNIDDNLKCINYYATVGNDIVDYAERYVFKTDIKTINLDGSYDESYPRINLIGDEKVTISYGDEYIDSGYIATDSIDGIITDNVEVTKNIDSFVLGEYEVNYKITNSRNNYVSTKRKIKVIENAISTTGTCTATVRKNEIKVDLNVPENTKIINYRYFINGTEETSIGNIMPVTNSFTKDTLPTVKVTINDGSKNNTSIICNIVPKLVPEMYTDVNGYNCLEGFVCYKQKDYSNTKYQATGNGVGTISTSGCLPTSMTIIATKYNKRSNNGNIFTPVTLVNEVIYTQGNVWGFSNYGRVKYIADKLNLKVSGELSIKRDFDKLVEALKNGNQIIANVGDGCYANAGGHYLTVIGINDNNQIFISDPYSRSTKSMHRTCTVNTWSDINEFRDKGKVLYFAIISE